MKRIIALAVMLALLATVVAVPALAADRNGFIRFDNGRFDNDRFDNGFFFNGFDNNNNGVSQELGNESESGDANVTFDVSSSGDFAQQCVAPLQFANTGNLQNAQGALQYNSTADDIEFEGSEFGFFTGPGSGVSTTCDQAVQQSAAASG